VIPRPLEMALVLHRTLKRVPRLILMAQEATATTLLAMQPGIMLMLLKVMVVGCDEGHHILRCNWVLVLL
jgi:hypothetical protein